MAQPEIVFALYRPHEGKAAELEALLRRHVPVLRELELVTDRPPILCSAADGTYLEIFEWADEDAADRAHHLPAVAQVWEGIGQLADLKKLSDLAEVHRPFAHFKTVW